MYKYKYITQLLITVKIFRYDVPYVYTIEIAESRLGVNSQESTLIISIIGNTFLEQKNVYSNFFKLRKSSSYDNEDPLEILN